ncbi:MAG: isoleucine--tRNA ligase [Buchnera aphidicola (Periphyllus acericola)]|uniref:isoleucine--tRNA ligase n=1 Tax=Buchnera aphidicola TaxID=9 RepID=UPI0030D60689|nr:isoleucine--tRNA ligase [Buchnera aphidicola (Periphyllus acericola)]
MKNFKKTLQLPQTNFSMRGNLPLKEKEILIEWKKKNIYKSIINSKKKLKKFIINDGPPYANGNIHIGHALNKILKDIIIKFKNLSGYYVPFIPCWDCHGLPIEHSIEKKYKKKFKNFSKKKIREKCRKYALNQVKNQKKDFIRLGILADWKNPLLTMDYKNQSNIIKILLKILKKKYLYQGLKPIHWCIECQSSLAEAEVEYKEKTSESIYFSLKSIEKKKILQIFNINKNIIIQKKIYLIVWTTTPWTLPASQAISINPNFIYKLIDTKKKIFIIEESRTNEILKIINIKKYKILSSIKGNKLENSKFYHPFLNNKLEIILSNHVVSDVGTGIVHTAPAHGQEDYIACKKYNISPKNFIDSFGNYKKKIHKKLNNKNIFNINLIIINLLKKNNSLLKKNAIKHSYPYCWRHKTPVIFRSTNQWFINLNRKKFKEKTIKIIKKVSWIPKWTKENMVSLVDKRPDWCISRQRSWGVPLPFFIHKKTKKLHKNTKIFLKKIIKLIKKNGIEEWWKIDKNKLLKNDSKNYKKSKDILDVWFESGCMYTSSIYKKNKNQKKISNLYIEGSDQHRGWFMSSLIISSLLQKTSPYKKVITHGFTIDKDGKKMSKSIGNTISPNSIIKKYGADILRLWVASSNYSKDISISEKILKQTANSYRKIRNTARFFLGNIYDFNPKKNSIKKKMLQIDVWAIKKAFKIQKKIINSYKKYQFHKVIKLILNFCFIDMSSIYLDIIKDRLYTSSKNGINRRSCQTTIFTILQMLNIWIFPIIPFTSYEIWKNIPNKKKSIDIFKKRWFKKKFSYSEKKYIGNKNWKKIFKIKNEINRLIEKKKEKKEIKNSLKISLTIFLKKKLFKTLKVLEKELKYIFLTSECFIKKFSKAPENLKTNKFIKNIKIQLKLNKGKKCKRCWNYFKKKNESELICKKCLSNILGKEINRVFA